DAASDGPGCGSLFTLRLPIASTPAPAASVDSQPDSTAAPPRVGPVLIVDDNRDALDTLVDALRAAGLNAVGASTPDQALDAAGRVSPHVVVLDIGLPDMNGYELARVLRTRNGGAAGGARARTRPRAGRGAPRGRR